MNDPGFQHQIGGVKQGPGELSFEAHIGGRTQRVWFHVDTDGPTSTQAILPTCLLPAMGSGGTLQLPEPVSPRVLRNQREFQGIQRAWSRGWEFGDPPLEEVAVVAPEAAPEPSQPNGRVAAFFSAGVDSWSVVLDHPELTDLIFARGIDIKLDAPHQAELGDLAEARVREAAEDLGLTLHVVETNLRDLSDPLARWEAHFGCALAAVALFLEPRFERVLMAGGHDFEVQEPIGTSRLIDRLWSTERLEVAEASGCYNRVDRTALIASNPIVQRTLRVCWENPGGAYNCGHCRKCLMTMITLEALGVRSEIETFPPALDLDAIEAIEVRQTALLTMWEDMLDAVRAAGRADLEPAVEEVVEKGKRELGLPPTYRRRTLPGPPRLAHPGPLQRIATRLRRRS